MDVQTENRENGPDRRSPIKAIQPKSKIIVVTSLIDCAVLDEAKRAGPTACGTRTRRRKRLMDVRPGKRWRVNIFFRDATSDQLRSAWQKAGIYKDELKVLRHLLRGLSYTRIAEKWAANVDVKFHVPNMLQKTGLENKLQLALAVSDVQVDCRSYGE